LLTRAPYQTISAEHLEKLGQQIYRKLGLYFDDKKNYFLKTRVAKRMAALGMDDPNDYIFMVSYADTNGLEMQALANLVTTNETYMFREYDQLQGFANYCLPEVLSAKQDRGEKSLRIWCAGCSSGEEPYTLAMIVQEVFPQSQSWDCKIVATDIDENMLRKVAAARYGARSVNDVPDEYKDKYLIEDGDGYVVRRRTAALVESRHLNLNDRMALRAMRGFDFIFCRNVLIYFDDLSRKRLSITSTMP
jgi:chemotaxis protein methyltransferase CheR